jgi:hypothetical protein
MTSHGASARLASIHVYPMKACRAADVYLDDPTGRPVDPEYGAAGSR